MNLDEEDYKMFLEGDVGSFEKLVLRYKDNLIYFIQRYVSDFQTAEDLCQDAFVEVYIHKERFNFKASFKTYLFTIGRNKAVDYIRHTAKIFPAENVYEAMDVQENTDTDVILKKVIADEGREQINKALMTLKKEYQTAIDLIDFEQLSYKEAAVVLKLTMPQMKILIHRARKALRVSLERNGYVYEK